MAHNFNRTTQKRTRRDGTVYFVILTKYAGNWHEEGIKFPTFIDAVLYERKRIMKQTVKTKYIFGDTNA